MKTEKEYKQLKEKYDNLNKIAQSKLPKCKKCGSINIDIKFGIQMNCLDCGYGFGNLND